MGSEKSRPRAVGQGRTAAGVRVPAPGGVPPHGGGRGGKALAGAGARARPRGCGHAGGCGGGRRRWSGVRWPAAAAHRGAGGGTPRVPLPLRPAEAVAPAGLDQWHTLTAATTRRVCTDDAGLALWRGQTGRPGHVRAACRRRRGPPPAHPRGVDGSTHPRRGPTGVRRIRRRGAPRWRARHRRWQANAPRVRNSKQGTKKRQSQ